MKEIKAVIFDCDGVIVDSEIVFLKSLQSYLKSKFSDNVLVTKL